MSMSKPEIKQLLERLIFEENEPQQWVEDVWDLSPLLGDSAARLKEVFDGLIDCCDEEKLENLLHGYYQDL